MSQTKQKEVLSSMSYELQRGTHTFTMCKCGRTGCRSGRCIFCLAEDLLGTEESHMRKDNHRIGIELESYTNILFYRGLEKEHQMLLEVASRLK